MKIDKLYIGLIFETQLNDHSLFNKTLSMGKSKSITIIPFKLLQMWIENLIWIICILEDK